MIRANFFGSKIRTKPIRKVVHAFSGGWSEMYVSVGILCPRGRMIILFKAAAPQSLQEPSVFHMRKYLACFACFRALKRHPARNARHKNFRAWRKFCFHFCWQMTGFLSHSSCHLSLVPYNEN